jgi:transcriptional regulator of acetoin/glycerol metabolism
MKTDVKGATAVDEFEHELIVEILRKHDGKVKEAAEELGMHRSTLWRKMKRLKISHSD